MVCLEGQRLPGYVLQDLSAPTHVGPAVPPPPSVLRSDPQGTGDTKLLLLGEIQGHPWCKGTQSAFEREGTFEELPSPA